MISGISSYNNRNYNHRSPLNKDNKVAFGQLWRSFRTITDTSGNAVKLQHDTYLCRPRVIPKISKLPDLLQKRFPEGASVIVHAVSNGEEAYTTAIALREKLGEAARKFMPVIGRDIDPESVETARSGIIVATPYEISNIDRYLKGYGEGYFRRLAPDKYDGKTLLRTSCSKPLIIKGRCHQYIEGLYKASDELRRDIRFEYGDFFEDAKNPKLFERPCAFLLHNQLYHIEREGLTSKISLFFRNLYSNMKPGSLFLTDIKDILIGGESFHYPGLLGAGFRPLSEKPKSQFGIYEKPFNP